jgi:multisubunit Na+/H+ antiporter MnhC subunit
VVLVVEDKCCKEESPERERSSSAGSEEEVRPGLSRTAKVFIGLTVDTVPPMLLTVVVIGLVFTIAGVVVAMDISRVFGTGLLTSPIKSKRNIVYCI